MTLQCAKNTGVTGQQKVPHLLTKIGHILAGENKEMGRIAIKIVKVKE